jgi:hypothetical protein
MWFRNLVISVIARAPWLTAGLEALVSRGYRAPADAGGSAVVPGGSRAVHDRLTVAVVAGTPQELGAAEGELFAARIAPLLKLMTWQPRLLLARRTARFRATLAAISPATQVRLTAVAAASGVAARTLLEANALVDAQCSAVVALPAAGQPLRVARNMDFFPARQLGPETILQIVRGNDQRAYASITWPGSAAVISGMNDAGVVACILLNLAGADLPGGEPVGLRLAAILAHETTLAGAVARFAASPVGSSHYVLLADAENATLIWQDHDGLHQDHPVDGWLIADNGPRRNGTPCDARGCQLAAQARNCTAPPDAAWLRRSLTASYMLGINAQAMLFEPASRTLELALGSAAAQPAATAQWQRIPLADLFAGTVTAQDALVVPLAPSEPLRHYLAG